MRLASSCMIVVKKGSWLRGWETVHVIVVVSLLSQL